VSAGCERERGLNDLALCNFFPKAILGQSKRWKGEGVVKRASNNSIMPGVLCPEFANVVEERYQILLLLKLLPGTCRKLCSRYEIQKICTLCPTSYVLRPNLTHPHSHPITHIHSPLASPPRVLLPADPALHRYLHGVPHLHAHVQLAPYTRTATALTRRWCRAECKAGGKCGGSE